MPIYLPIAELSVNLFTLLGLGAGAGLLAGMFGVGGGFVLAPLLIFIGISPAVAVAASTNQILASSLSGFLAHFRRSNVDFRMGNMLMIGGLTGSTLGIFVFRYFRSTGQIDLLVTLAYVFFLGSVGALMGRESFYTLRGKTPPKRKKMRWRDQLPLQMNFPRSETRHSMLLPLLIGAGVGVLVSLLGVGGGFFLVPAMIYLLGLPTALAVGTSLYQTVFVTANVTMLQALTTQTVDVVLAVPLLIGGVAGAQAGTRLGAKLPSEHVRGALALIVLAVALRLAYGLFVPPANPFSVVVQ